ncbi:MAG: GLUG motif-containing protein [Acidobacteriota bacterium]
MRPSRLFIPFILSFTLWQSTVAQFSGGDGSAGNPYLVASFSDLNNVRNYASSSFRQIANITGAGFLPIPLFYGTYDGGDFTITGVSVDNRSANEIGLFGRVCSGATIKNVRLKNFYAGGQHFTGALAGTLSGGSIINCSSEGEVGSNGSSVGGLVGIAEAGSLISRCWSTASVSCNISDTYNIGGLVGSNAGTIENSFASGPVGGYACGKVAGFVGYNTGTIRNCYSTGTVTGLERAAGFCGSMGGGSITNCYSIGDVTGIESAPKGFCAQLNSGTVAASFWNMEASGCASSEAGTAVSDSLMGVQTMYETAGWTFDMTAGGWFIGANRNNGYPSLYGMTPVTLCSLRPQPATSILTTSATLHARVMPLEGGSSTVYFLYGKTNGSYTDSVLAMESPVTGSIETAVSAALTGLTKGCTYYFTVSSRSSAGYYRGSVRSFATTSAFSGGAGTLADPYLIGTLADLIAINTSPFKDGASYFRQIANIDASPTATMNGGLGVQPIAFKGSYDGQGYSITNIRINYAMVWEVGLFSQTGAAQTIANVRLVNAYIVGGLNVGGIVGANGGIVRGCSVSGSVYSYHTESVNTGGCVGFNTGTIDQCYSSADVASSDPAIASSSIGGFVGANAGTITNCYATGAVGYAKAHTVGGFAGENAGTITNCYSTGKVTAAYNESGFLWSGENVTNCFWDKQASGIETAGVGTGKTTTEMKTSGMFTAAGWDFATIWGIDPVINNGYPQLRINNGMTVRAPAGDGTPSSPYQITCLTDLYWISITPSSWSKRFVQTVDIDAAPTAAWDDSAGFTPIGNNGAMFSGVYDGQHHTISSLYIKRPLLDGVGFIGYKTGAIRDLGMVNAAITGGYGTGALVGVSYFDTVSGCWSTGSVKSADQHVGGLVGENSMSGIVNSYSFCAVQGSSWVGGLAGSTGSSAITNCYSAGPVSGSSNAGGLTGSGGTITNSFWDVEASGMHTSGGGTGKTTNEMKRQETFAGWDFWGESANGTSDLWGMLGAANGGYPSFVSQLPVPVSSGAASVVFLKPGGNQDVAITATGAWSVESNQPWLVVSPSSGTGNGTLTLTASANADASARTAALSLTYAGTPYALAAVRQTVLSVFGTEADPFLIDSYAELKKVGVDYPLSAVYRLTVDIDAAASAAENAGAGFMPIGTKQAPFSGVFHGGGHAIRNLTINRPSADTVGLFGCVGAFTTIDSLRLRNVAVTGKNAVGGLAGTSGGTISQCSVTGTVQGSASYAGGLLGYGGTSAARVTDCSASAAVSGRSSVGGLIGRLDGQAHRSYATGPVTGASGGYSTGGFIGTSYGDIADCYAAGPVSGSGSVGGFAGSNLAANAITDCYAAGSVTASGYDVGGFCGENYGEIGNCYTLSQVSGYANKGALIGYMGGGSLSSTYWSRAQTSLSCIGKRVNGSCTDTAGLDGAELRKSTRYTGWDFASAWMIREDSTYPGLRRVVNNIPSAVCDTINAAGSVALSSTLTNDFDIEKGNAELVFKLIAVYGGGSITGGSTFTFSDERKDSVLYRVGEVCAEGDTLWSAAVKAMLNNTGYVTMAGSGNADSPYLVARYGHLKDMHEDLTKVYRLAADIDASASAAEMGGRGFQPIGDNDQPFTGVFHGGGHVIRNLHINQPDGNYIGLFGYASEGAVIDSVGLTDVDVTGYGCVGGLAGEADGALSCVYTTGSVIGGSYVGGVAGACETIDRSFSSASVTGETVVGGLAGYVFGSAAYSYASGPVTATGDGAGGFAGIGINSTNCYATGNVIGQDMVGGFAGYGVGQMKYCYASGSVTGTGRTGAFSGAVETASVEGCYWNRDVFGPGFGADDGASAYTDTVGLSAAQMDVAGNFAGWDFVSTWEIVPGGSPKLRTTPNAALPVELTKFTVSASDAGAALAWSTATETNNYGFEIERMKCVTPSAGVTRAWMKIGFVQGSGTANAPKSYGYLDRKLAAGKYSYRLKQIDTDGKCRYSASADVVIAAPKEYALAQNYPNPFNPSTTIGYQLPVSGKVKLVVYDILGKEAAVLVDEAQEAGTYRVQFDASRLSTGVYFCRLTSGAFSALRKMLLVK